MTDPETSQAASRVSFDEFIRVKQLSWAGVQMAVENTTLVIDPLENVPKGAGVGGVPRTKMHGCPDRANVALITHTRDDHYDVAALRRILKADAPVVCSAADAAAIKSDGFRTIALAPLETVKEGPFTITGLPAVDGLGEDQLSYLVEVDGVRVLHCGDTLWHGYWYRFARDYGPIDVAFLPINGALIDMPGVVSTGVPVTMTPFQAAAAADVLCAKMACPIHYGMFNHPPNFREWPDALDVFAKEAADRDVPVRVLVAGEEMLLDRVPPSAD